METRTLETSGSTVIVGGGPAGMSAAIEAVRAGLRPTLIDDASALGGQAYRGLPEAFRIGDSRRLGVDYAQGERLREEFAAVADRVERFSNTSILGLSPRRALLWSRDQKTGLLQAAGVILATGARDRPVPFPGWTLPGVMTAGAALTLLKTMRIRPGRRALVAGTGTLLLSLAARLLEAGVEVVAILDAGDPPWQIGSFPREWGKFDVLDPARKALDDLQRRNIPFLTHQTIFEAVGPSELRSVSYGPIDVSSGRLLKGSAKSVDVDLAVIGFGFMPNSELSELAGCRHELIAELGGWVPIRSSHMETTVPGLFAVGDGAGIRGAAAAIEEGRIAGITVAEQAGTISAEEADRRRRGPTDRLRSLEEIRSALANFSCRPPELLDMATRDTIVCRCEEVRFDEVQAAIDQGSRDLQAVKLSTRLGMGSCQGRNCALPVALHLCRVLGRNPAQAGRIHPRLPLRPITLAALASMEDVAQPAELDPTEESLGGQI